MVGQVYGTGCQVILEVTNTRSYWVNLRVTPVGNGLVLTPDGDLAISLMGYRVLPPRGSIRFNATFTAAGQSVMAILDGTASIDQGAREMTYVQAMVDLLSLTGVIDSTLTIDLLVEYYPALRNTLSVSPNLQEAFLNLTNSDYQGFIQAMQRAAAEGEVTVFGQTLMDVGAAVAADRLGSFIDDALGAGYLNALVVIFSNYGAVLSRAISQPAGFIIFNAEGAAAPLVTDPDVSALNPVTRNADWTPIERDFDGVTMVLVPAGCFMMGSDSGQNDEQPVHEICFDQPFWIDKYEVTQEQFWRYGGTKLFRNENIGDNRPEEWVSWSEARSFCVRRDARLPTEAEWEYTARGPDSLIFPWGNEWDASRTIWSRHTAQGPANVGSIPTGASWVGALDMAGNVWEWTNSLYEQYPYDANDGREVHNRPNFLQMARVLRGGAWALVGPGGLTGSVRFSAGPDHMGSGIGYGVRCARDFANEIDGLVEVVADDNGSLVVTQRVTRNADWTPVVQDFDGVPMVQVPPGCFMMGMTDTEIDDLVQQDANNNDLFQTFGPQHQQCFDEPFWIDLTEVTQAQFTAFAGRAANASYFSGDNRPVEQIGWFEARDFCALRGVRLPTEAEWEYAARGPDSLVYPWGNEWNENNAVADWNRSISQGTANVSSIPSGRSWVGAFDLIGNVWEWVNTIYGVDTNNDHDFADSGERLYSYPYTSGDGREVDNDYWTFVRVVRGGSWYNYDTNFLRSAERFRSYPWIPFFSLGFRCARSS